MAVPGIVINSFVYHILLSLNYVLQEKTEKIEQLENDLNISVKVILDLNRFSFSFFLLLIFESLD